jgi:hypothetical protein
MGKKLGAAAVVSLVGMAWVPWIATVTLVAFVSLLLFVAALAFSGRGVPISRVIALVRAVKSPRSPPARRNHRRAKPPPDQP